MMFNLADPSSAAVLAAGGGDTVKLFDLSVDSGDPCILTYTPSPASHVNSVKWNHTNLVVASAGDDKKISFWRKSGQNMGALPAFGSDGAEEERILAISFSSKGSRYMCSGGTGQVVRIWDLQRKRCIKWLKGHADTITGAMYNCKDEHLASISLSGNLILHNLASGTRVAELKDPNEQVLRMLDYSRISRHLLVTAGDDGSVHLWDTTGRSPKTSWLKQHSAPTAGVSFSPTNDKVIASIGLDKKLYTFDSGVRRPSFCSSYEAPFTSLAFRDDGWTLAAGTSHGRVVFYDVRGKPQPLTVLRAYSSSEAVMSLCWQRSNPVIVNESNCSDETALLGGPVEDPVLMPDPLPSLTSSSISLSMALHNLQNPGHSGPSVESSSFRLAGGGSVSSTTHLSMPEETPQRSSLGQVGKLARLSAPRSNFNFKDDMEVFSPLVDVQPITPSLIKLWDDHEGIKKDIQLIEKKPSSLLFPSSSRRFPSAEDGGSDHPVFNWKSSSTIRQDDTGLLSSNLLGITPFRSNDSSITPQESLGTISSGLQEPVAAGQMSVCSLTSTNTTSINLQSEDVSSSQETIPGAFTSISPSFGTSLVGHSNFESFGSPFLGPPRRFSTYAERISTAPFSDGTSLSSPKTKKTGAETREELWKNILSKSDTSAASDTQSVPLAGTSGTMKVSNGPDPQQGASFTLQLVQRSLEETLVSFQSSMHADLRNLHIEILRQFQMQETEMSGLMSLLLENQAELMKEVQSLRKENQQLRQLL